MLKVSLLVVMLILNSVPMVSAEDTAFDTFLTKFDYETRADMKIDSKKLITLLAEKKAVLVDIRFPEEIKAWKMGFGIYIPLNELPKRLAELPKDKIIVTACPHKDRSSIAMTYLRTKGYKTKYLTDGLIGLAENLRGDNAKEFLDDISLMKQ